MNDMPKPIDFVKAVGIAATIYATYMIGEKLYRKAVMFLQDVLRETKL